jgi:hypothetical protein
LQKREAPVSPLLKEPYKEGFLAKEIVSSTKEPYTSRVLLHNRKTPLIKELYKRVFFEWLYAHRAVLQRRQALLSPLLQDT